MSPWMLRRAVALAAILTLVLPGLAAADTAAADGDAVTAGNQSTVDMGTVRPGGVFTLDVDLQLACDGAVHAAAGAVIDVTAASIAVPGDGSVDVTPGRITVPATWPAAGEPCPVDAAPVTSDVPVHLAVTAPTIEGMNRIVTVEFALAPAEGVTGSPAVRIVVDVQEPPLADTTPPVLAGVPGTLTAVTSGAGATVSWPGPTATDDTDPNPVVGCAPASGSLFPVGTTTVTCTATDASGNAASASFDVIVSRQTVRRLRAVFLHPANHEVLFLRGEGRLPVRLAVLAGHELLGPEAIDAPTLRVEGLVSCERGAAAQVTSDAGTFAWSHGTWYLRLAGDALGVGCWRLTAVVDGASPASITVRVVDQHWPHRRAC